MFLPFRCTGTGPLVGVFAGHVLSGSPDLPVFAIVSQVSSFWQFSEAFSQIVVRWFWTISKISVFENRLAFEMSKQCFFAICRSKVGLYFFGGGGKLCPKNAHPEKSCFLFMLLLCTVSMLWRPLSQLEVMKTVCFGRWGGKICTELRHLFLRGRGQAGLRAFGQTASKWPYFVVYALPLPLWEVGGILGAKWLFLSFGGPKVKK